METAACRQWIYSNSKPHTLTVNFHSADGAGDPLLYRLEGQPDTLILLDNGQQVELQS